MYIVIQNRTNNATIQNFKTSNVIKLMCSPFLRMGNSHTSTPDSSYNNSISLTNFMTTHSLKTFCAPRINRGELSSNTQPNFILTVYTCILFDVFILAFVSSEKELLYKTKREITQTINFK